MTKQSNCVANKQSEKVCCLALNLSARLVFFSFLSFAVASFCFLLARNCEVAARKLRSTEINVLFTIQILATKIQKLIKQRVRGWAANHTIQLSHSWQLWNLGKDP